MKIIRKIQQTLITHLNKNLPINGAFTHIPKDALFPIANIINIKATPWQSSVYLGYKLNITIQILSKQKTPKEVIEIMELAEISFNNDNIKLKDFSKMLSIELLSGEVYQNTDMQLWIGEINLEIQILTHSQNFSTSTDMISLNASY